MYTSLFVCLFKQNPLLKRIFNHNDEIFKFVKSGALNIDKGFYYKYYLNGLPKETDLPL